MNARCSPPRILAHHAKNQLSNLLWGRPSPNRPSHPRNQFPIQPKTCSVPADHRIGRDHDERLFPLWPESTYCNPEGLIEKPEVWPRMAALQDDELLAEDEILKEQGATRAKEATERSEPEQKQVNMAGSYNKLPRESVSYVADSSDCKHFGEAQTIGPCLPAGICVV